MVNRIVIAVGIGVLAIAIVGVFAIQLNSTNEVATQRITKLTWERSGGFAGVADELIIDIDGFASYESRLFGNSEIFLDKDEVVSLLADAESVVTGKMYPASDGMADFFIYRLTIQTPLISEQVEWVDEWASAEALPAPLVELQERIETIVMMIEAQGSASEEERAYEIAQTFVLQGPTFSFDGIPDTLLVTDMIILESFPPQYRLTMSFDSSHAGYGNRDGQALAQVITMHEIVVTVVRDAVVSAVIDLEWDELEQAPRDVRQPPSSSGQPPQLIVKYSSAEYQGLQSTYCWGALCVDYISVEMREDLAQLVPIDVIRATRLSIGVEDHDLPERFFIQFYDVKEMSWLESISITNDSFIVDLEPGEYFLLLSTAWEMEGDTSNIFRLIVAEP
jgi:hypothetical protein